MSQILVLSSPQTSEESCSSSVESPRRIGQEIYLISLVSPFHKLWNSSTVWIVCLEA